MTAAVRAGAEPLYSANEGLAEDGVGEGLQMNVLFRGTHTEMIYRHWGYVVGKKSDGPATESCLPEGSTGDGSDPFPRRDRRSWWCCCLQDETSWVFPSIGFPEEVLGLKPQQQSWAAAAHLAQVEEQVRGRGVQSLGEAVAGA